MFVVRLKFREERSTEPLPSCVRFFPVGSAVFIDSYASVFQIAKQIEFAAKHRLPFKEPGRLLAPILPLANRHLSAGPIVGSPGRSAVGRRSIKRKLTQQPCEGQPGVALDGHGRMRLQNTVAIGHGDAVGCDLLPRLFAAIPGFGALHQEAKMKRF
jgi:hypothetical protein